MARSARTVSSAARVQAFWDKLSEIDAACRRGYPRVHANVPVRIHDAPGGSIDLATNDLSLRGLQIACDRKAAERLRPSSAESDRKKAYTMTLLLRISGKKCAIRVRGRIVHLSLSSNAPEERQVTLGVHLIAFDKDAEQNLMRYLEQHLYPAEM